MKKTIAALLGGLLIGVFAATHAKLPPAPWITLQPLATV